MTGTTPADLDALDALEDEDFWAQCRLTTILSSPPRHELVLPGGQVMRLNTGDFFDVETFRVKFIDATGSFPALPEKKTLPFLRDLFRGWLETRSTRALADEASDRGTLIGDIRIALLNAPETDDPIDMLRGALHPREDGSAWVNARVLFERVRRSCPVKVAPAEFYEALSALGMSNLDVQRLGGRGGWRGRVWTVPAELRPEAPEFQGAPELPTAPATPEQGAFDDLLAGPVDPPPLQS